MANGRVTNKQLSEEETIRMRLHALWNHHDGGNPSHFLEGLAEAIEKKTWEKLGVGFKSFIENDPPTGIGVSWEQFLVAYQIRHRKEKDFPSAREKYAAMRKEIGNLLTPDLNTHGGDRKSEDRDQGYARNLDRGNNIEYLRARLKSEGYMDLLSQVSNGEKTAAAAAREAGIVQYKRRATIYPDDIFHTARILLKHFDANELHEALEREIR